MIIIIDARCKHEDCSQNLKLKEQLRDQNVEGIIIFKDTIKIKCWCLYCIQVTQDRINFWVSYTVVSCITIRTFSFRGSALVI